MSDSGYGTKRGASSQSSSSNKRMKGDVMYRKSVGKRSKVSAKAPTSTEVKKAILSMSATKHYTKTRGTNMIMDEIYTYNITEHVVQGTTDKQRIGDEIYLSSLTVKGNFFSASTAGAYQYRVAIVQSGEEYSTANFTTAGLSAPEMWLPDTDDYSTQAQFNNKSVTVLHDERIDINSQIPLTSDIAQFNFKVALNKKFQYQEPASSFGKKYSIYAVIYGFVFGGTSYTTSVGQGSMSFDLAFKSL